MGDLVEEIGLSLVRFVKMASGGAGTSFGVTGPVGFCADDAAISALENSYMRAFLFWVMFRLDFIEEVKGSSRVGRASGAKGMK